MNAAAPVPDGDLLMIVDLFDARRGLVAPVSLRIKFSDPREEFARLIGAPGAREFATKIDRQVEPICWGLSVGAKGLSRSWQPLLHHALGLSNVTIPGRMDCVKRLFEFWSRQRTTLRLFLTLSTRVLQCQRARERDGERDHSHHGGLARLSST